MREIMVNGEKACLITTDVLVVGSGASGYNAALQLHKNGRKPAVLTEGRLMGTSRNTGSDKQTYYKLSLSGSVADSPFDMGKDIFSGGCTDGDSAYAEAAMSARCFMHLTELGVPFPMNKLGEFVGYKTDHDKRSRATSAGPLTSKLMTEKLENAVTEARIPIFDGFLAIKIVTDDSGKAIALLALNKNENCAPCFFLFNALILATGGPAGMYAASVFPESQNGAISLALDAGAYGKNLTEWQYGLASIAPRWNVSGTYMQVLPRMVSVDEAGNEREFLTEYFIENSKSLSLLFRKGYEWPFDSSKAKNGSSVIDLLVWYECSVKKRRVYLDYTQNPGGAASLDFDALDAEARDYLKAAQACFGTPIERLRFMNEPAYQLYLSKGVDLEKEKLEIALCAQHSNGGVSTDIWWKTSVAGLFVIGEAAGTHGIKRPGGSALNAGQVGALRAALYISSNIENALPAEDNAVPYLEKVLATHLSEAAKLFSKSENSVTDMRIRYTSKMSDCAAAIRNLEQISSMRHELSNAVSSYFDTVSVSSRKELFEAYRLYDSLKTQYAYLGAMLDYAENGGASRGSAIYLDSISDFNSLLRFTEDTGALDGRIQETRVCGLDQSYVWRDVRPLPEGGGVFENVWRDFRNGEIFK
ncbi:MAG: FAD-binding protein [Clostridia bacterium]|nr:FAD-binding protein [Clostridia bacterium]